MKPFIFLLVVIIALEKWIIFLKFSVCSVNNSLIRFTRAVTTLYPRIKRKTDSKLNKQQLFHEFWWYFITGAAGWNCNLCYFCITNRYPRYLRYFCIITPKKFDKVFYNNLVHVSWNFLLATHHWIQTNVLISLFFLGSYISWFFLFFCDSSRRIVTTCSEKLHIQSYLEMI